MEERWHGTAARYSKKHNSVAERRVKNFDSYGDALLWLDANQYRAIMIWHDNAVNLDNPYFAMIETQSYKDEYKKVID
jgi:hypothetical protein